MDLIYCNKTLLVNIDEQVDCKIIRKLETRLDNILREYNIENVEIALLNETNDEELFNTSIKMIKNRHHANIYLK